MFLNKKHKLYFRESKTGAARRLDKTSIKIYMYIIKLFLQGDGEKRYQEKNKSVTHWSNYKPIEIFDLPGDLQVQMERLTKAKNIEIYYGGTWKPLVMLHKFKKKTNEHSIHPKKAS